jgi:hypothetical protein
MTVRAAGAPMSAPVAWRTPTFHKPELRSWCVTNEAFLAQGACR